MIQLTVGIAYIWSAFQTGVARRLFPMFDVYGNPMLDLYGNTLGYNALAGLTFSLLLASLTISSVFGGKLAARLKN